MYKRQDVSSDIVIDLTAVCIVLGAGIRGDGEALRNRHTGSSHPVSYTHLDVYKRQKYGTPNPVPFRVVDQRAGIDIDIGIRCFGEYSYRVVNPILFYTNVCGNVENAYTRDALDGQLKTELMTALQPAFARISEQGIRYSAPVSYTHLDVYKRQGYTSRCCPFSARYRPAADPRRTPGSWQ